MRGEHSSSNYLIFRGKMERPYFTGATHIFKELTAFLQRES